MVRSLVVSLTLLAVPAAFAAPAAGLDNPQIDYVGYSRAVLEVGGLRDARRVTEQEFLRMAAEPGTVVLDARSERLYKLRHIKGAVNLSFPDFTATTLADIIPTKDTRVLIYCNNNFTDAPTSMPVKAVASSLNVSTFVSLHTYGYRNVYELGPAVEVATSKLAFAGTETRR
ncbi:sulfurtransferase [Betaproteobacteria bacterium GR16-43]|nr:sulfurtransferase [Betaproteobacteria bacterium GR16-43]